MLTALYLVIWLVLINNIFNGLAYPFAGSLGSGLRAAGDVRFTMIVPKTIHRTVSILPPANDLPANPPGII